MSTKSVLDPKIVIAIRKMRGDHFEPLMSYAKIKDAIYEKFGVSASTVGVEYAGRGITHSDVEGPDGWVAYPLAHTDLTISQKVSRMERSLGLKVSTSQSHKDLVAMVQSQNAYDVEKAVRKFRADDFKALAEAKKAEAKPTSKPASKPEPKPSKNSASKSEPKPAEASQPKPEPKKVNLTAGQKSEILGRLANGEGLKVVAEDFKVAISTISRLRSKTSEASQSQELAA